MDAQNSTSGVVFDYGLALMNGFREQKRQVLGFDMEADCYRTYVVRPGDAIYISKECPFQKEHTPHRRQL